jgi:carnosine N-methyltransferase
MVTRLKKLCPMMWSETESSEFSDLLSALRNYREASLSQIDRLASAGVRSPEELDSLRSAVRDNADLFELMAREAPSSFVRTPASVDVRAPEFDSTDLHQLCSVLRIAARDWTSLGDCERSETYGTIVGVLQELLEPDQVVLVPGSGPGRLAVEIASRGFVVHANENSFAMLVVAWVAFTHLGERRRIWPFCHQLSGLDAFADSLVAAEFPDAAVGSGDGAIATPMELIGTGRLALMAGGFAGFARTFDEYDAVATSYFLDVVEDLAGTIEIIHQIVKPGGYWVNFGPRMLHHPDGQFFTTATFDDVAAITRKVGFQIIREERIETTYIAHPTSHIKTVYRCKLTVARK